MELHACMYTMEYGVMLYVTDGTGEMDLRFFKKKIIFYYYWINNCVGGAIIIIFITFIIK